MRQLLYQIGNVTTTSYETARKMQPSGTLKIILKNVESKPAAVSKETFAKRKKFFASKRKSQKTF